MSEIVLGLDQSLRMTGFAVLKGIGKDDIIESGRKPFNTPDEAHALYDQLDYYLSLLDAYKPDITIYEDIQYRNNAKTFKQLAKVQAVYELAMYQEEADSECVQPSSWRKKVGIDATTRAEQKKQAKQLVMDIYGKKATEDEAEAILIARSYYL